MGALMKLTERKIETLAVENGLTRNGLPRKEKLFFDDEQRGLAVRVTASGGRTYLAQYTMDGQKWRMPLGACSALSLAQAREAAAAVMGDVAKGVNPWQVREERKKAERAERARDRLTLRALIDDWHRLHLANKRPRYAKEAVRALHWAFADTLDDAAEDLDRATVVRTLDALTRRRTRKNAEGTDRRKGNAMTGRTAAYGRAAFAWAVKRGTVQTNPFADLPVSKASAKRERVLNDNEIAQIWHAAGEAASPYGTIIRLMILTGQRRGEVAGMTWGELSADLTTWTLPRERTKNGVVHVVPLSERARDLIRATLPKDADTERIMRERRASNALVLPGAVGTVFSGWSKCKTALDKAINEARAKAAGEAGGTTVPLESWTIHDLRRTLATGLQRLDVRLEVTEAVLNHVSGSRGGIAGVYQRHDWAAERRTALDRWANYVWAACVLATATKGTDAEIVLPFARAG
jgi:integrase